MTARTIQVLSVTVFWLVHFVASLFAAAMLVVAPLHPEDFTELEFMAAQVLLFPVFNVVTYYGSLVFLVALNSTIWAVPIYGLVAYLRSKFRAVPQ